MMRLAERFPDEQIVAALSQQLGWTHFKEIIPLEDPLQRDFYAEMCRIERWSTRTLHAKIQGMLYERTAISKKPEEVIRHDLDALREEDRLTPDLVFRDPYVLDFLGLKDSTANATWSRPSCGNWRRSCWNSARISPLSPGRSGSRWTTRTTTSTSSSTTGG